MDQENTAQQRQITAGSVAKYALLPGILPRLKRLGFVLAKFLHVFTTLFGAAGLIPANHPCLRAENIGRYKFTEIVGLAAHNVKLTRAHLPQTIMFFAIIGAYLLTILTVVLSLLQMVAGTQAHAQFFSNNPATNDPRTDYAYEFLTQVFGKINIGDLWLGNGVATRDNPMNPLINVFGEMMSFYSKMLLVVAAFLIVYLLINTVISAARTGRPWGEKFDSIWAPLRLAAAIGLLVPVHPIGYNGAQLMVFQAAHWGSAIATNMWTQAVSKGFSDDNIVGTYGANKNYNVVRAIFLMEVCKEIYNKYNQNWGLFDPISATPEKEKDSDKTYIQYSYGTDDDPKYCGSIRVKIPPSINKVTFQKPNNSLWGSKLPSATEYKINELEVEVKKAYERAVDDVFAVARTIAGPMVNFSSVGTSLGFSLTSVPGQGVAHQKMVLAWLDNLDQDKDGVFLNETTPIDFGRIKKDYNDALKVNMAYHTQFGWANAGGFFLRISKFASEMGQALESAPEIVAMPVLLAGAKKPNGEGYTSPDPDDADNKDLDEMTLLMQNVDKWFRESPPQSKEDNDLGIMNWDAYMDRIDFYTIWKNDTMSQNESATKSNTTPVDFGDYFQGLRADSWFAEFRGAKAIHPIGELAAIGNRMIFVGAGLVMGGAVLSTVEVSIEVSAIVTSARYGTNWAIIGQFMMKLGSAMVLAGFMLAIYVPAIPFMFFMFAVVEWIASILEAVIGMPLWCLSLISIEGEGLGKAQQGFNTFFEIMLKPAIIVISLIACALLYTGAVRFINYAYGSFITDSQDGMTSWVTAVSGINPLIFMFNMFFYLFLIYSITNSIFKMMNDIPTGFFKWAALQSNIYNPRMGADISQQAATMIGSRALDTIETAGKTRQEGIMSKSKAAAENKLTVDKEEKEAQKEGQQRENVETQYQKLFATSGIMGPPTPAQRAELLRQAEINSRNER